MSTTEVSGAGGGPSGEEASAARGGGGEEAIAPPPPASAEIEAWQQPIVLPAGDSSFQVLADAIILIADRVASGNYGNGDPLLQWLEGVVSAWPDVVATVLVGGTSLFGLLCEILNSPEIINSPLSSDQVEPSIRFLIDRNPHALAYSVEEHGRMYNPMHRIAYHYPGLMPMIAEHHGWILSNPTFGEGQNPAHKGLLIAYSQFRCGASVLKQFFELYPQGLRQVDRSGYLPIQYVFLWSHEGESDVELIKWMASIDTASLLHQDRNLGSTLLNFACGVFAEGHVPDYMVDLCCFLIKKSPESVHLASSAGVHPIHWFVPFCHQPAAQQVILAILREHVESAELPAAQWNGIECPAPSTSPFIQRVTALLREEQNLGEEFTRLIEELCEEYQREAGNSIHSC